MLNKKHPAAFKNKGNKEFKPVLNQYKTKHTN